MINSKIIGNKSEAVVLAAFVKEGIPVLLPFGDNEKYDLVFQINGVFKSVQTKTGQFRDGCVRSTIKHRIGFKRLKYESYYNKVDFIAIWCEELDKIYLLPLLTYGDKTQASLRVTVPRKKANLCAIHWAKDYEFSKIIKML